MANQIGKQMWHSHAIYQIYPRSFYDSDGDGVGDLNGIIQRLDYLKKLGITMVWLCPICDSPNDDNGYDVSNYYSILKEFGTMADFEHLIAASKERGIKIIMDLVLNHSSDEHPWFLQAKCSKDNSYRDFYIWRDPVDGKEPNDLMSSFGGSAWTYSHETNQYYFHSFSKKQPDLNWENKKLRHELYKMINFWIEKGVGGFRLDAIDNISKVIDHKITNTGPKIHDYLKEMHDCTFGRQPGLITVGETSSATPELAVLYTDPARSELDMVFQFELMSIDGIRCQDWTPRNYTLSDLKTLMTKWQKQLNNIGWNSLFWDNHDFPRAVSRFGNDSDEWRELSAKMLATLLHGMKGVPYIYQGEEIGMTNIRLYDIRDYRDIETRNFYKQKKEDGWAKEKIMSYIYRNSRDNARTPMQWNDHKNAGFTQGKPWIDVNPNYKSINVANNIHDRNSIFYYYQKLLKLRRQNDVLVYGDYHLLCPEHDQVFAYDRVLNSEKIIVVCNFFNKETRIHLEEDGLAKVLINNYGVIDTNLNDLKLRPYEAVIYQID